MRIHDEIFKDYLLDNDFSQHWIFDLISEGAYSYQVPDRSEIDLHQSVYHDFMDELENFKLMNQSYFNKLFPNHERLLGDTDIMLYIGAPKPYDAVFRFHEGKEYMCFDIDRMLDYKKSGRDVKEIARKLIIHEFTHRCIHNDYAFNKLSYAEELDFYLFDEGFAHLFAYQDDIENSDLNGYSDVYKQALIKLKAAYQQVDNDKQRQYIDEGITGAYWDKYLCVLGKMYLWKNIDKLEEIYQKGFKGFGERILNKK